MNVTNMNVRDCYRQYAVAAAPHHEVGEIVRLILMGTYYSFAEPIVGQPAYMLATTKFRQHMGVLLFAHTDIILTEEAKKIIRESPFNVVGLIV